MLLKLKKQVGVAMVVGAKKHSIWWLEAVLLLMEKFLPCAMVDGK